MLSVVRAIQCPYPTATLVQHKNMLIEGVVIGRMVISGWVGNRVGGLVIGWMDWTIVRFTFTKFTFKGQSNGVREEQSLPMLYRRDLDVIEF